MPEQDLARMDTMGDSTDSRTAPTVAPKSTAYAWRVGDVFTNGTHRWVVDSVLGDKAVMRSLGSSWATTIPLTFSEWREGGRWYLEVK
jgi:hypothetical protein